MGERLALVLATLVVAAAIALVVERRRPAPPAQGSHPTPRQLDRADFPRPDARLLVVVFSARSCASCARVLELARELSSEEVEVFEAEASSHTGLHRRYGIESVPITVVAEAEGVVQAAWVGSVGPNELAAAIAGLSLDRSLPLDPGGGPAEPVA